MKQKMKRLAGILISFALATGLLPGTSPAAHAALGNDGDDPRSRGNEKGRPQWHLAS